MQQNGEIDEYMTGDSWIILTEIEKSIKAKVEAIGTPLSKWEISINYGIKTGFNDAFIISSEKRDEILSSCASDEERLRTDAIIRPILRGRDIRRYGYNWANLWLINVHNGIKGSLERIHIEDYPAVKKHLDEYWLKIESRADQGDTPYNLRNCAYLDDLSKPKIIWGEISDRSKFYLDNDGDYCPEATTFLMTGNNLDFLLAFLNCKLSEYLFSKIGTTTGVGTVRWKKFKIEQLPVPQTLPEEIVNSITSLAKIALGQQAKGKSSSDTEKIIDQKIYESFGLTPEEIQFVEEQ